MKFQSLLIVGLLLVPFISEAKYSKKTVVNDEPVVAEVATAEPAACECLNMRVPVMEKVSTRCSVRETAPAQCFTVRKVVETDETYRIPGDCKRCCTITDENGTRPCGCEKPCAEKPCACHRHHCCK